MNFVIYGKHLGKDIQMQSDNSSEVIIKFLITERVEQCVFNLSFHLIGYRKYLAREISQYAGDRRLVTSSEHELIFPN